MIKVFISVPMRNRTKENIEYSIRKMKRIARAFLAENDIEANNGIEFINTIVRDNPPKEVDERIWYLGAAIQLLSKADYLICPSELYNNPGCEIERYTFEYYKGYDRLIEVRNKFIYPEDELKSSGDKEDDEDIIAEKDIITPDQC